MRHKSSVSLRSKIILYTAACVVVVGLVSNLVLYAYMQRIIEDKVDSIDALSAQTITAQINNRLLQVQTVAFYCANAPEVADVLRYGSLEDPAIRQKALTAQNTINAFLRVSPVDGYVEKLLVFNERGVIVHAVSVYSGNRMDRENIMESERYLRWKAGEQTSFDRVELSLNPEGRECFVMMVPVYLPTSGANIGCVYMEVSTSLISEILSSYSQTDHFLVGTACGGCVAPERDSAFAQSFAQLADPTQDFLYGTDRYRTRSYPLTLPGLTFYSCIDQTALQASNQDVLFSMITVCLMILVIVIGVVALLTHYVTTPIAKILDKIRRIALNDYSYDPELEKLGSEMGEVGAQLNQLGMGIETLLHDTIALHDERTEIEMALLQSQVNPHFLYNTLNSVRYMAQVQKNPGIEKMVRSLVSLLKNLSKGVSNHIPLSEELSLLNDYVVIQSIRYIGAFEYICEVPQELMDYRILKFTLQPLVENAIFHGVVPKGGCGTIRVSAHEDGAYLVLTVTDDGVGMEEEEIRTLLQREDRPDKSSLSGIGMGNVNRRLKLAYGKGAGLSIKSVKGEYTAVSVRILKETGEEEGEHERNAPDPAGG